MPPSINKLITDANLYSSVMNTMRSLVDKYPEGFEGWERDYQLSQEREVTFSMADMGINNSVIAENAHDTMSLDNHGIEPMRRTSGVKSLPAA
jgi:hypothetical protein